MERCRWGGVVVVSLGAAMACADTATLPAVRQAPAIAHDVSAGDDPDWPVAITEKHVNVYMPPSQGAFPADALIAANMLYDSHHASIEASAVLTGNSENVSRSYGPVTNDTPTFYNNYFSREFHLSVPGRCGYTVQAGATFKAWLVLWPDVHLDPKVAYGEDTRSQSACSSTPVSDAGGGGGRSSYQVCTTTQWDYYWYYPATGTYEYRYTDYSSSCTAME